MATKLDCSNCKHYNYCVDMFNKFYTVDCHGVHVSNWKSDFCYWSENENSSLTKKIDISGFERVK